MTAALAAMPAAEAAGAEPVAVVVQPLPLNPRSPGQSSVGALEYLAGYELRSGYGGWGGFSGMTIAPDGSQLIALTDFGLWLDARLTHEGGLKLTDVHSAFMLPMLDTEGRPLSGKRMSDAEALAGDGDGWLLVAFERADRLWRYPATGLDRAPAEPMDSPLDGAALSSNAGAEGVAVLNDGTIVVLTEGAPAAGTADDEAEDDDAAGAAATVPGWIRLGGAWHPIGWRRNGLFRVTDAAALPNGDLIVLERRFTRIGGPAARLSLVPRAQIRPDALLVGQELAVLRLPHSVDNFEALAVRSAGDGSLLIYILSDDNRHPLQRTLLLQFRLRL